MRCYKCDVCGTIILQPDRLTIYPSRQDYAVEIDCCRNCYDAAVEKIGATIAKSKESFKVTDDKEEE